MIGALITIIAIVWVALMLWLIHDNLYGDD